MHRSQQITDYIMQHIIGDLSTIGSNVFYGRVLSLTNDEVPAITVKRGSDSAIGDRGRLNNGRIDRYLEIIIGIGVKESSRLHDRLNEILVEIYEAMMASSIKADLEFIVDFWHVDDSEPSLSGEAEKPIGTQETLWIVHYTHSISSPAQ